MINLKEQLRLLVNEFTNYGAFGRTLKKHHNEIYLYVIDSWNFDHKPASFMEQVYQCLYPTNIYCPYGNKMKFEYFRSGYTCKKRCQCSLDKKKKTMLERYGVEHALQSSSIKLKFQSTMLERYGYDNLHESFKEERTMTNLERYGAETPLESKKILAETRKSCQANNGFGYPFQSDKVQRKANDTVLEKYGVPNVLMLDKNRKKLQNAVLKKYGTLHNFNEYKKSKLKEFLEKKNVTSVSQLHIAPEKLDELKDDEMFTAIYNKFDYVVDIADYFGVGLSTIHKRTNELKLKKKSPTISKPEQELSNWISNIVDIVQSDRSVIAPKEIDILVPSRKLGIEFNGLWHHSTRFVDDKYMHLSKTKMARQQGYDLIHIFEDEWMHKQEIVKSRILNKLGKSTPIYARETTVVNVSKNKAHNFVNANHLQGTVGHTVALGLEHNNQLVAIMTFSKPRFNKTYEWEVLRCCGLIGYNVVGGASKLIKNFVKQYKGDIISYADTRWGTGNLYKQIGFEFIKATDPNYFYTNGSGQRHSRNKYQKHKLKNQLAVFDSNLSEELNMKSNGYYRIYDCGNTVWRLLRSQK